MWVLSQIDLITFGNIAGKLVSELTFKEFNVTKVEQ